MSDGFSRENEDEVIAGLLEGLGDYTKICADIGAKAKANSNVANLIVNHGWSGVLLDRGVKNFQTLMGDFWGYPVCVSHTKVTPDNINALMPPVCTVLTIDIDGQDYWVWQAIETRPPIVLIEYNPRRRDGVMARNDRYEWKHDKPYDSFGASKASMINLGKRKGYRVAGHNENNLFFVL